MHTRIMAARMENLPQYDPHLVPQLQWAGKAEHTSFEVPTVSLHVHERIDPKRIIETVKMSPAGGGAGGGRQLSLFETHKKLLREAIEFYKHKEDWSNRLVAGDSLLVMNSFLEKEGIGGKVQMVYFDPPSSIGTKIYFVVNLYTFCEPKAHNEFITNQGITNKR